MPLTIDSWQRLIKGLSTQPQSSDSPRHHFSKRACPFCCKSLLEVKEEKTQKREKNNRRGRRGREWRGKGREKEREREKEEKERRTRQAQQHKDTATQAATRPGNNTNKCFYPSCLKHRQSAKVQEKPISKTGCTDKRGETLRRRPT